MQSDAEKQKYITRATRIITIIVTLISMYAGSQILTLMSIIPLIVEILADKKYAKKEIREFCKGYPSIKIKESKINNTFNQACTYVMTKCDVNNLCFNGKNRSDLDKDSGNFTIDDIGESQFIHNGNNIYFHVNLQKDGEKSITFFSHKKSSLNNLLNDVISENIVANEEEINKICNVYPSIRIFKGYNDSVYHYISWYLMEYCNIQKLATHVYCIQNDYSHHSNSDGRRKTVLYELDDNINIKLKYNNDTIYCISSGCDQLADEKTKESSSNNSKIITLSAENIDIVKTFINEIIDKWTQFSMRGEDRTNNVYTWDIHYNGDRWKPSPLNIIKTKENVFLSKANINIFNIITQFYKSKQWFTNLGIPHKEGILLYGLPGTGKSSVIYAISNQFKMNIYKLSFIDIDDQELIRRIGQIPPKSILLCEDVDSIKSLHNRNTNKNHSNKSTNDNKQKQKVINLETILHILDGYTCLDSCIIFFTTNHREKLDPALLRCGRMDVKYEFGYCDGDQITDILKFYKCEHLHSNFTDKQITSSEIINKCLEEINI